MSRNTSLHPKMLNEAIDNIRGAVMIGFPMGLPDYDFVRMAVEDNEELGGTSVNIHFIMTPYYHTLLILYYHYYYFIILLFYFFYRNRYTKGGIITPVIP